MNCMVDIETFGPYHSAAIVSIGAVKFNEKEISDPTFKINIDWDQAIKAGTITTNTLLWWLKQPEEVRQGLFNPPQTDYIVALNKFAEWYLAPPEPQTIWSHATFDIPVLSNAYTQHGLQTPWHYRDSRDIRTLHSIYKEVTGNKFTDIPRETVKHDSLEDAIYQAKYVQQMWKEIRKEKSEEGN